MSKHHPSKSASRVDPALVYLIAASAPCDPATARKVLRDGFDSLRPMTADRVRRAMERLKLLYLVPKVGEE